MRTEFTEREYQTLFVNPIASVRFSVEELTKMFEDRMLNLSKFIIDNELTASSFKSTKSEIFRSIEGYLSNLEIISIQLKRNIEKSFEKIEESDLDSKA